MALRSFKVAYAYDAAGRLVREGGKTYRYGYLDKVLSVTDGERRCAYDYHADGQLARASYGSCGRPGCPQPADTETFDWDGLALVRRGDEHFLNEPHVGGGNPVTSSKGTSFFNDMLGTTVGIWEGRASARPNSGRKYTAAALTAFGETIENESCHSPTPTHNSNSFYTGKPHVAGLGHVFLFRNYRASLAKWQTADPLGYPDGWNQLAYCNNGVTDAVDLWGGATATQDGFGNIVPSVGIGEASRPYHEVVPGHGDIIEDIMLLVGSGTVTIEGQRLEIYSRSMQYPSVARGPYLLLDGREVLFVDTTTLYETWEIWSFDLTVTKDTILSTLLRKANEGATITSVACLLTLVGGRVAGAATIAAAISLLEKEVQERYSVQDRLLILSDQHSKTVTTTRIVE